MTFIGPGSPISIKNQDNPLKTWPQVNLIWKSPQLRFYCWVTLGCVKVTVKSYPSALYSLSMKYMLTGDSSTPSFLVIDGICDSLLQLWTWPNLESPGKWVSTKQFLHWAGLWACPLGIVLRYLILEDPKPMWVVPVPRKGSWIVYGWKAEASRQACIHSFLSALLVWYNEVFEAPRWDEHFSPLRCFWSWCPITTTEMKPLFSITSKLDHHHVAGFKITLETRLWVCLWGCDQRGLRKVGSPTLKLDSTIPWSGIPGWIHRSQSWTSAFIHPSASWLCRQ